MDRKQNFQTILRMMNDYFIKSKKKKFIINLLIIIFLN